MRAFSDPATHRRAKPRPRGPRRPPLTGRAGAWFSAFSKEYNTPPTKATGNEVTRVINITVSPISVGTL